MRPEPHMPMRNAARPPRTRRPRAFTIVELVLVVAIIGVLSAVILPRLDGRSAAAGEAAVMANLAVVRQAIDRYAAEHGGAFPGTSAEGAVSQLTMFSDASGQVSATRQGAYLYGPYLQAIPPNPVWTRPGRDQIYIDPVNSPPQAQLEADAGWVYNPNTGEFYANSTELLQFGNKLLDNPDAVLTGLGTTNLTVEDLLAKKP